MFVNGNRLTTFILVGVAFCSVRGEAQTISVGSGSKPPVGVATPAPEPADLTAARLYSPREFAALDVRTRRKIMNAWASHPSLGRAESALLLLIEAGLVDDDQEVREHSIAALQITENEANIARFQKRPPGLDPTTYPSLYNTLLTLLGNADVHFRSQVVKALTTFEIPQRDELEKEFLERWRNENSALVRSDMVSALAEFANRGSASARQAVLDALDDAAPEVQTTAIRGARQMRIAEALPRIAEKLTASRPDTRSAVVLALDTYGDAVLPYASWLAERLSAENDPRVRSELQKLVDKLNRAQSLR